MKTKFLLIYGYLVPFLSGALVSALPYVFGFVKYYDISTYFSKNIGLIFTVLAFVGAITFPFQTSIFNEDNPHVLAVLGKSKVRTVFINASIFQACFILGLALLVFVLSLNPTPSILFGYIQLFASSLIIFESIALISNGRAYTSIREKIIMEVNKVTREP